MWRKYCKITISRSKKSQLRPTLPLIKQGHKVPLRHQSTPCHLQSTKMQFKNKSPNSARMEPTNPLQNIH